MIKVKRRKIREKLKEGRKEDKLQNKGILNEKEGMIEGKKVGRKV